MKEILTTDEFDELEKTIKAMRELESLLEELNYLVPAYACSEIHDRLVRLLTKLRDKERELHQEQTVFGASNEQSN